MKEQNINNKSVTNNINITFNNKKNIIFICIPIIALIGIWITMKYTNNQSVHYQNCDEARMSGAAPLYYGEPGYASHLDGDGDGIACE